eukprot:gb/GECH01008973.1/.p1 GENE.gb/GECH01008973.1/~~gb/GECH01008973.1/.p1  ORF type:complete len:439 (+),score=124.47 gb/GECH01008973.1/:1-1317(+)
MMDLIFKIAERGPESIKAVLEARGWREYEEGEEENWNLWWRNTRLSADYIKKARTNEFFNHFPKSTEITRKDLLLRHLRKSKGIFGSIYNISPDSFVLPTEYVRFMDVFGEEEQKGTVWICKPSDLSRGRKIFLIRDLTELRYDCHCVVQKYVQRPLLLYGYKFDLRLYVLATSFNPLGIFVYKDGLARFGTEKYDPDSLDNKFAHLTNASINKYSPLLGADKDGIGAGAKWTISDVFSYLEMKKGINTNALWQRMINVVILSFLTVAGMIPFSDQCFELFGFDIIIDSTLKPWLLEINFSPSLHAQTDIDEQIKPPLLNDMMDAVQIEKTLSKNQNEQNNQKFSRRRKSNSTQRRKQSAQVNRILKEENQELPRESYGQMTRIFPFNTHTMAASKVLSNDYEANSIHATKESEAKRIIVKEIKEREREAIRENKGKK